MITTSSTLLTMCIIERSSGMETLGWVSLIPVVVVIVMAVITKKAAESLIVGTFVGAAILVISKGVSDIGVVSDCWNTWFDYLLTQIGNSDV